MGYSTDKEDEIFDQLTIEAIVQALGGRKWRKWRKWEDRLENLPSVLMNVIIVMELPAIGIMMNLFFLRVLNVSLFAIVLAPSLAVLFPLSVVINILFWTWLVSPVITQIPYLFMENDVDYIEES